MKTTPRILVADDDPVIRQFLSQILGTAGYDVSEAANGHDCLRMIRESQVDVVLLDVILPDVNGIEVCRQIKSDAAIQDVFVVLCSGYAMSVWDKVDGLGSGADDYFLKPVDPAELLARIRTILRLRNTTAALRRSEHHYRRLIEILPDAVVTVDLESRLMTVNPQAVTMLGYANEAELIGKSLLDLTPPEEHERIRTDIATALDVGVFRISEYTVLRKNGDRFSAELNAAALVDVQGRPFGLVGMARDITQRRQAEEALRESEARKGAIMQSALDAIITINHEGRITDFNPAAEKMFGETVSKVLGREVVSVIIPASLRGWFRSGLAHLFSNDTGPSLDSRIEITALRADATEFPAEFTITRIQAAGPPMFTAFIRDISRRKRAEERVQLLAYAVQTAREFICITDHENRFTFANEAFLDAYGYSEHEILGKTPDFLYSPGNPPGLCEQVFRRTLDSEWRGELLNLRKDGSEFPISLSTSQIKNREGRILGLIGVARDISMRKLAEEELRRLHRRVIETQEAERQRVARELHDGVNQIIASAKMRLRKVEDHIAAFNPAAREILSRCSDLLVKALEENRRIAHDLRPSDLDNLGLAAACRNFCKEFQARSGLMVKTSITQLDRLPSHVELHLFRIVQEALTNVEKHARAKRIRVRIAQLEDVILLKIHDDGRGLGLETTKAGKKKGRGAGLSNMRERAAFLGGSYEVASAPKQGTTITVQVPWAGHE